MKKCIPTIHKAEMCILSHKPPQRTQCATKYRNLPECFGAQMGGRTNITLMTSVSDAGTDFHILLGVLILQRMTAQRKEAA